MAKKDTTTTDENVKNNKVTATDIGVITMFGKQIGGLLIKRFELAKQAKSIVDIEDIENKTLKDFTKEDYRKVCKKYEIEKAKKEIEVIDTKLESLGIKFVAPTKKAKKATETAEN